MLAYLPPEIIEKIILLSLQSLEYTTGYSDLLAYSLVDRTWRRLAQAELFESVVLDDAERTERLFAAVDGTAGIIDRIRSLRFGRRSRNGWREAPAEGPWTSIPGLVEVQVEKAVLRLDRVGLMTSLRRLHLRVVRLPDDLLPPPRTTPPLFIHLVHLSLVDLCNYGDEAWTQIICPSILTALRSITLAATPQHKVNSAERGITKALSTIGPQILSLAIFDSTDGLVLERALVPCLAHFTSLDTFFILGQREVGGRAYSRDSQVERDVFAELPTSLRSLTILAHVALPTEWPVVLLPLLESLQSDAPGLRCIKRISIPRSQPAERWVALGNRAARSLADDLTRVELRSFAAAGQFVLDETGAAPGLPAFIPSWHDPFWGSY